MFIDRKTSSIETFQTIHFRLSMFILGLHFPYCTAKNIRIIGIFYNLRVFFIFFFFLNCNGKPETLQFIIVISCFEKLDSIVLFSCSKNLWWSKLTRVMSSFFILREWTYTWQSYPITTTSISFILSIIFSIRCVLRF